MASQAAAIGARCAPLRAQCAARPSHPDATAGHVRQPFCAMPAPCCSQASSPQRWSMNGFAPHIQSKQINTGPTCLRCGRFFAAVFAGACLPDCLPVGLAMAALGQIGEQAVRLPAPARFDTSTRVACGANASPNSQFPQFPNSPIPQVGKSLTQRFGGRCGDSQSAQRAAWLA